MLDSALKVNLSALTNYNQFVLYKIVPSKTRPGKMDKITCTVDLHNVDAHNPNNWMGVDLAVACAASMTSEYGHGVGFVFTANDPFFFVDIDGAYDGTQWSRVASDLCSRLPGCAVEISQSGTGLHIFGQYSGPEPVHGCKNKPLGLELYTSGRFAALTGTAIVGDAGIVADGALLGVIESYFTSTGAAPLLEDLTAEAEAGHFEISDDAELIKKALKSQSAKQAFGNQASFADLWNCNVEVLGKYYPDESRPFDNSAAECALANHLIFWTSGNCERAIRLLQQSALAVGREAKYTRQGDNYLGRTMRDSYATVKANGNFYSSRPLVGKVEVIDVEEISNTAVRREGYQFMSIDQQEEHFKGCVYVTNMNKIFTPNGTMLKQEQFNVVYGGYDFNMVNGSDPKTSKKAWEAFTESQGLHFPKVDVSQFRPKLPPGSITIEEGQRVINSYIPAEVDATPGDVTPFLNHLAISIPDERDRTILLSYMAACVQHVGYKIQWAPVIQGCEGNGKTLFTRCLQRAVGKRYTHWPQAHDIDNPFNSWLSGKLLIAVEEIKIGSKYHMLEVLKPMITNDDAAVTFKGVDQSMSELCCNFMFTTNYKDAIPVTVDSRRYALFFTAQQSKEDMTRDGMTGDYFPNIYNWLNNGGYGHVTHYLREFAIPEELNPTTTLQVAPRTTSTLEAVNLSLGNVEQEIIEAIEEGRPGFKDGWVSATWLDELLRSDRKNNSIPRGKRDPLMKLLGYVPHPGLKNGRVNNTIPMDNNKRSKLYIKEGHIHANLQSPAEIAKHYMQAQSEPTPNFNLPNTQ